MDKLLKISGAYIYSRSHLVSNHLPWKALRKAKLLEVRCMLHQKCRFLSDTSLRSICNVSSDLNQCRNLLFLNETNFKQKYQSGGYYSPPPSYSSLALLSFGFISACCATYESGIVYRNITCRSL